MEGIIGTIIAVLFQYGSVILGILFAMVTAVNLIVEVAKRLVPRRGPGQNGGMAQRRGYR